MPIDPIPLLFAAAGDGDPGRPWVRFLVAAPAISAAIAIGVVAVAAAVALGWFMLAVAPERHARAALRAVERPLAAFGLGFAALVPLIAVAAVLVRHHAPLHRLIVAIAAYALAAGWSVAARALGERAAPGATPVVQTGIGLAALLVPCLLGVGLPVALVAAPLGVGAWLLARREADAP